jgi:hypothetical protein
MGTPAEICNPESLGRFRSVGLGFERTDPDESVKINDVASGRARMDDVSERLFSIA